MHSLRFEPMRDRCGRGRCSARDWRRRRRRRAPHRPAPAGKASSSSSRFSARRVAPVVQRPTAVVAVESGTAVKPCSIERRCRIRALSLVSSTVSSTVGGGRRAEGRGAGGPSRVAIGGDASASQNAPGGDRIEPELQRRAKPGGVFHVLWPNRRRAGGADCLHDRVADRYGFDHAAGAWSGSGPRRSDRRSGCRSAPSIHSRSERRSRPSAGAGEQRRWRRDSARRQQWPPGRRCRGRACSR